MIVANIGLLKLNTLLLPGQVNSPCQAVRGEFGTYAALALIVTAVAAPLFEKTEFRGFLYGLLRGTVGFPARAVLSGLISALYHLDLALLLPLWFVGIVLATIYEKSRSLFLGMLVHALYTIAGTAIILFAHGNC